MIYILLSIGILFLCFLEPICDSIQDTLDHHQSISIFSKVDFSIFGFKPFKNQLWWNSDKGWLNKYNFRNSSMGRVKWRILGLEFNKPVQLTDGWHHFKMWKLIFSISGGITLPSMFLIMDWYLALLALLFIGSVRNKNFTIFYKHVLIVKK